MKKGEDRIVDRAMPLYEAKKTIAANLRPTEGNATSKSSMPPLRRNMDINHRQVERTALPLLSFPLDGCWLHTASFFTCVMGDVDA